VQTLERERRACVIDFRCAPRLRDVTGRTRGPEGLPVSILMTGAARRERDAFERVRAMAGFTSHRRVRPGQRKRGARMVEAALRIGELDRGRVTRGALRAQRSFMRVRVTRSTRHLDPEKQAGLVTRGA